MKSDENILKHVYKISHHELLYIIEQSNIKFEDLAAEFRIEIDSLKQILENKDTACPFYLIYSIINKLGIEVFKHLRHWYIIYDINNKKK